MTARLVCKISKAGKEYQVVELYVKEVLVKTIFLEQAELTLLNVLLNK